MGLKKTPEKEPETNPKAGLITKNVKKHLRQIMANEEEIFNIGKYIYDQTREKIEQNDMEYIGEGMEGTVYKVEIEMPDHKKKVLLAIKRRFDEQIEEEIKMHKEFSAIAKKKSEIGVEVPNILGKVETNDGKYFLMEFVDGKTLFNLKMEKIAETFYERFHEKYPKFFEHLKGVNKHRDKSNINKASRFDFATDKEARNVMFKIIEMLNEHMEPMIKKYTGVGIALLNKQSFDNIIQNIYYDNTLHGPIFGMNEGWEIQQKVKDFLYACHEDGLFHRDLGGNPGNIMFLSRDNKIIPVIIDFGKAIKSESGQRNKEYQRGEGPYGDEHETYVPDSNICAIIKSLTASPPKREPHELYY